MPRPTAIFSSNDEMAAGVVHAARQRGLDIPRDLSVIGFDDNPIAAHLWPPLTTVRWPIASMARSAALKLIAGVGDNPEPEVKEPSMRSEEHTSELQSLMRISYAVFCLTKTTQHLTERTPRTKRSRY